MKPIARNQRAFAVVVLFIICSLLLPGIVVGGQGSLEQQKALNMIADFADRICKDIPLKGKKNKLELSGKAKAELRGIVKKFADLGLEGAAKYEESKYEGVLQSDLSKALQDSTSCKLKVFDSLKDKLISSKVTTAPFKPNPPSGLKVVWQVGKGFLITWIDNSTNELGFNIYRKYESNFNDPMKLPPLTGEPPGYEFLRSVPPNTRKFFDPEIYYFKRGDRIFYKISSHNETGESKAIESGVVASEEIIIQ